MKKLCLSLAVAGLMFGTSAQAQQEASTGGQVLGGDVGLACEAILCLSSGTRPSECAPSLARYFSITAKTVTRMITKRKDFLSLCPIVSTDDAMRILVNDIANGAGRCDAASLNMAQSTWAGDKESRVIGNKMPRNCEAYQNNAYTDLASTAARYVGIPERGGYWVEPADYDRALREYNDRIAREDAQRRNDGAYAGGGS